MNTTNSIISIVRLVHGDEVADRYLAEIAAQEALHAIEAAERERCAIHAFNQAVLADPAVFRTYGL